MHRFLYFLMWLAASCNSRTENVSHPKEYVQKRMGYSMMAQAMINTASEPETAGEKLFKVTVLLEKAFLENHSELTQELQYGVDSAFYVLTKNDTIWPQYVMPVANGQPLQPQFIVAFDQQPLHRAGTLTLQTTIKALRSADTTEFTLELPLQN